MYKNYSVLMAVYHKETAEYLKQAIDSILKQSVKTNDFVIVCDGPLTPRLDQVIEEYVKREKSIIHVVRLEQNVGLGKALNTGLLYCKNDLVARMDSDDISLPDRCELQLKVFNSDNDVTFCGGQIAEFEKDISEKKVIRKVPCLHEEIVRFAKYRNPMNHVTIMYKKNMVINAGNYIELDLNEDYYLWIRMLCKGYKAYNINKVLVHVRGGESMCKRRGGYAYVKKIILAQKKYLDIGFISPLTFLNNCFIRIAVSALPNKLRKQVYKKGLRKNN